MKMKKIAGLFAFMSFFATFAGDTVAITEAHSTSPLSSDKLNAVFLIDTSPSLERHIGLEEASEFVFGILHDLRQRKVDYNVAFVNLDHKNERYVIIDQSFSFREVQQKIREFYQIDSNSWDIYSDYYANALFSLSRFFKNNPSFLSPNTRLASIVVTRDKRDGGMYDKTTGVYHHTEAYNYYDVDEDIHPEGFCNGAYANICEMVRTPTVFLGTMFKSRREGGFVRTRGTYPFYVGLEFEGDENMRYLTLGGGVRFYVVSDFEGDDNGRYLALATQEISRDIEVFLFTHEIRLNHFPGDTFEVKNHKGIPLTRGMDWEYFEPTNTLELYNLKGGEVEVVTSFGR